MTPAITPGTMQRIPVGNLVPFRNVGGLKAGQPRTHFDEKELEGLCQSIRANGFTSQLDVRPVAGTETFEVLGGHRRLRAAQKLGMTELPCVVRDLTDREARELVLTDNLQRVDYLPWEEGDGYFELMEIHQMTRDQVASKVGKSVATVADRITIARGCGEAARKGFLESALTQESLVALAAIPNRILTPVKCPRCGVVACEGTEECPACKTSFEGVFKVPSGNPQEVAARMLRGVTNGSVRQVVERVKEAYGLADKPVQTSLGFSDLQMSQAAVLQKTRLESLLGEVAKAGEFVTCGKNERAINEYTSRQREAVLQQLAAAESILKAIRKAVETA